MAGLIYNYAPPTLMVDHPHDRTHQHNTFLGVLARRSADPKAHPNYPDMDILDLPNIYRIDIEVPGVSDPSSIKLQWENWRSLVVTGETTRSWEDSEHDGKEVKDQGNGHDEKKSHSHANAKKSGHGEVVGKDDLALHHTHAHIHDKDKDNDSVQGDKHPYPSFLYPRLAVEERRIGAFRREIHFPVDVEMEKLKAKLQTGLLTIELPKRHYSHPKGHGEIKVEKA